MKATGKRPCYDQFICIHAVSLNTILEEGLSYGRPVRHMFTHIDGVCH